MIRSLLLWFGHRARSGRSGRGAQSAQRFTPRLEALEDREVPSASALLGGKVGSTADVSLFRTGTGSKPGGAGDPITDAPLLGEVTVLGKASGGCVEV